MEVIQNTQSSTHSCCCCCCRNTVSVKTQTSVYFTLVFISQHYVISLHPTLNIVDKADFIPVQNSGELLLRQVRFLSFLQIILMLIFAQSSVLQHCQQYIIFPQCQHSSNGAAKNYACASEATKHVISV